jgi:monoamine oxidase
VPVNDKLWLTGEHTIKELNSFVHGAYLAGERAAREVLASLKKDAKRQM